MHKITCVKIRHINLCIATRARCGGVFRHRHQPIRQPQAVHAARARHPPCYSKWPICLYPGSVVAGRKAPCREHSAMADDPPPKVAPNCSPAPRRELAMCFQRAELPDHSRVRNRPAGPASSVFAFSPEVCGRGALYPIHQRNRLLLAYLSGRAFSSSFHRMTSWTGLPRQLSANEQVCNSHSI